MNGVHDMGGMHGFGSVPVSADDTLYEEWERDVFATHVLLQAQGVYNLDEFRHARERLPPVEYLAASYFENWLGGVELLLEENGVVTEEELTERVEAFDGDLPERTDPELVRAGRDHFESDRFDDADPQPPRFEAGDAVRVVNDHPEGHTRCPRYVRRAGGVVRKVYGTVHLPDATAHGDDRAEPLYSVRFDGEELWGEDTSADVVHIDMWESYLTDS